MSTPSEDELLAAVLDGEASRAESEAVLADPELSARLEQMRTARDAVAEEVPGLSELQAERLVAVASRVARDDGRTRRSRLLPWATAAAVVLMAGAVTVVMLNRDDDPPAQTASEAPGERLPDHFIDEPADSPISEDVPHSHVDDQEALAPALEEPEALDHDVVTPIQPPLNLGSLGDLELSDDLADVAASAMEDAPGGAVDPAASACIFPYQSAQGLAPPVGVGTATLGGQAVAVGVLSYSAPEDFAPDANLATLVVTTLPECAIVLTGPFEMLGR